MSTVVYSCDGCQGHGARTMPRGELTMPSSSLAGFLPGDVGATGTVVGRAGQHE